MIKKWKLAIQTQHKTTPEQSLPNLFTRNLTMKDQLVYNVKSKPTLISKTVQNVHTAVKC